MNPCTCKATPAIPHVTLSQERRRRRRVPRSLLKIPPSPTRTLQYRGTSLTRKFTPLGPYRRPMPRVLGGRAVSYERGTPVRVKPLRLSCTELLSPERHRRRRVARSLLKVPIPPTWTLHAQRYLAHKIPPPRRTLRWDHA